MKLVCRFAKKNSKNSKNVFDSFTNSNLNKHIFFGLLFYISTTKFLIYFLRVVIF